jgi:hypothetical protein
MRRAKVRIIDIDGTLAHVNHIGHHIRKIPGKNWKDFREFHKRSPYVPAKQQAIDYVLETVEMGMIPIVLTARREMWMAETIEFLQRVMPVDYELFMRPDDDTGNDVQFKKHILGYLRRHYDIRGAIEDNPEVAAMFEAAGIPVEIVPDSRWDDNQEINIA